MRLVTLRDPVPVPALTLQWSSSRVTHDATVLALGSSQRWVTRYLDRAAGDTRGLKVRVKKYSSFFCHCLYVILI